MMRGEDFWFKHLYRNLIIGLITSFLIGCSSIPWIGDDDEEDAELADAKSASQLYKQAHTAVLNNGFQEAVEKFELLEARYPFGRYAQQAQLELAYSYYRIGESDAAIANADRFIKLNPQHPHVDYAYYIKGIVNFDRGRNFVHYILPRDPSDNDASSLQAAFDDFSVLINNYPDSKYAEDAKSRIVYLRNELAEHEIKVAKFYMRRGAYVAAANRAKFTMEKYQGAEVMPEALYILEQAYRELELADLADDTRRVYAENFATGKGGAIDANFANDSCATNIWGKFLEKLRLKKYYCN